MLPLRLRLCVGRPSDPTIPRLKLLQYSVRIGNISDNPDGISHAAAAVFPVKSHCSCRVLGQAAMPSALYTKIVVR